MAEGATQRASRLGKREGGTLRKQLVAVFRDGASRREGVERQKWTNFTEKDQ